MVERASLAGIECNILGLLLDQATGYCAPYMGKICKKYLTGVGTVWFNNSVDNPSGWLHEKITTDLWDELIQKLTEPCRSAAEVTNNITFSASSFIHDR